MKSFVCVPLVAALLWVVGCQQTPPPPPIESAQSLIEAMHARYDGKWYSSLTFVQETIQHRPDGSIDTTTWYEAMQIPGQLRIDFGDLANGQGILFRADTIYQFNQGNVLGKAPQVHPLLVLGFDVYGQPPAETIAKLEALNFDMTVLREDVWQERPVYVVGAEAEDTQSPQFWIDKEHLYFVRQMTPVPGGGTQEIQFNEYVREGGGWIAPEVLFYVNGTLVLEEYYHKVRTGVSLDADLFDPAQWSTAPHWYSE